MNHCVIKYKDKEKYKNKKNNSFNSLYKNII